MGSADCVSIREYVSQHPGEKIGFIVFRLTYMDDGAWARFMEHLNNITKEGLEMFGDGDLFPHIDWSVQDDPLLGDVENWEPEVRKRFHRIIEQERASHSPERNSGPPARHQACIAVTQRCLERTMRYVGTEYTLAGRGSVWLVSVDETEHYRGWDNADATTIIDVDMVFPRAYTLFDIGWEAVVDDQELC